MSTLTVRKNFNFDKDLIDKTASILKKQNKNFTEVLTSFFQAIVKEPTIIETVEQKAKARTGSFIGMLDGVIGEMNYKDMKKEHHENIS